MGSSTGRTSTPTTAGELRLRFFDHFLKGVDNDVTSWPKVLLEIREQAYVGEWHEEKEWPLARTDYQPLYLDAGSGSLGRSPVDAEAEVRYDSTAAGARAVFDHRFDEDTDLVGYLKLKLWVEAVGADDMDLFVGIQRLDGDGNVVPYPFYAALDDGNVALGWLRASHRELDTERSTPAQPWHTHRREEKLEPGVPVPVEIEIWPTGTRFLAGDTLRVIVQGRDIYDYPESVIISRHEDTRNAGEHVIPHGRQVRLAPADPGSAPLEARQTGAGELERRSTIDPRATAATIRPPLTMSW